MSKRITLTAKTVRKDYGKAGILVGTLVKQGKTIQAKIYPPSRYHPEEFSIEMSGLGFYRPTLDDALEFVRSQVEDRMRAFGSDVSVVLDKKG